MMVRKKEKNSAIEKDKQNRDDEKEGRKEW